MADATGEAFLARHGLDCGGETVMLTRVLWLGVCLIAGIAFWMRKGERAGSGGMKRRCKYLQRSTRAAR